MRQQDWTEQLRQRLADHEEPVPADLWAGIEQGLGPSAVNDGAPQGRQQARGRRARIVVLRWTAAAACVLLLFGTWLLTRRQPADDVIAATAIAQNEAEAEPAPCDMVQDEEAATDVPSTESIAPAMTVRSTESATNPEPDEPEVSYETYESYESYETYKSYESNKSHESPESFELPDFHSPQAPLRQPHVVRPRRYSPTLSLHATNLLASNGSTLSEPLRMSAANMGYATAMMARTTPIYMMNYREDTHHDMPLIVGLSLRQPLTSHWWLSTGIDYSLVNSSFTRQLGNSVSHNRQHLHYLGVPLTLGYTFWQGSRLTAYASGGGEAQLNIAARIDHGYIDRDRIQFSLTGAAGLEYRLLPHLGVYVQPGLRYYPDNGSQLLNIFKEHPLQIDLQIGLRYSR